MPADWSSVVASFVEVPGDPAAGTVFLEELVSVSAVVTSSDNVVELAEPESRGS